MGGDHQHGDGDHVAPPHHPLGMVGLQEGDALGGNRHEARAYQGAVMVMVEPLAHDEFLRRSGRQAPGGEDMDMAPLGVALQEGYLAVDLAILGMPLPGK